MADVCRACKEPLLWAMTPAGKKAPITRAPDVERGNVLVLAPTGMGTMAITLTGDALSMARRAFVPLRLEHHANCPDAKLFT